jgi:hypothetical protein
MQFDFEWNKFQSKYYRKMWKFWKNNEISLVYLVYPHRAGLKNMPGHGGDRTYDLWNTGPWASIPKVV